jgi:hypothetical protein
MKTKCLNSIVVLLMSLALLVSPGVAAPTVQTPTPPDGSSQEYPFDPKDVVSRSAATIAPTGGIIDVAVDSGDDEIEPAVALCAYDQYLVVYENNTDDEIYGQRVDSDGDLLGSAFLISGDSNEEASPDVACDWTYNRFVVVWQHNYLDSGDWDIRARGVYGGHQTSGSQLYGTELIVSQDAPEDEMDPAIACNSNEHTCLVVFEYSGDIYGQRVAVGSSNISKDGGQFIVSNWGPNEVNPDVAWGGYDDDYLVVWQYLHSTPTSHYRVFAGYVYDTNQAGSQLENGAGTFLIGPGSYDHDQTMPAAAYNPDTGQYLAVFQYDYYGNGSDYDIEALRLTPGGGSWGSVFSIASSSDDELSPAVAFSGGTQSLPGGMGANQYLVTYIRDETTSSVVYGQAIKGTHATIGGQREGAPAALRSTFAGPNFGVFDPAVIGSINNGRYMVVWEDMMGGVAGDDYDVLGRMVAPYAVYLPLAMSRYSASFGFQPNPDGYSFSNYGNSHYWQDDLGVADLINMFGAGNVCASGSTPADCVLTASAETWRQQMLNMGSGGHCEGMAVTSLRFFKRQTYYTGDTTPGDFQGGAQRTYDLSRDQSIDNYIMYYFALQDVEEIWYPTGMIRISNTPKQILQLIRDELDDGGNDPYTMGIYHYDSGSLTLGHAITPYDVVDKGGGTYWLYVYDNNYPGQARYIVFDTNADTWYYNSTYQGSASTKNLDLTRLSYRNQEPFTPPFTVTSTSVEFFLIGGGDMLITNAAGQRIGYDPATGQRVNEIPGAHVVYLKGVSSPMYRLPIQQADQLYQVTVSGQNIATDVSTNLVMVGPGYVVGFENIRLQPGQNLSMSLSADGRHLLFEEGQTAPAPEMFMGVDEP